MYMCLLFCLLLCFVFFFGFLLFFFLEERFFFFFFFRFSVFSSFFPCPCFYFFLFQAVDCLLNRTCVSDVVEKGIGAPTVEDSGTDTSLGLASERRPKAPLSAPPGASKASQNNDVDIIDNEETPGLFEDFVKADSSVHDFEIESGNSVPSTKCNVKGRLRALVGFWEDIHASAFIIDCVKEGCKIPFYVTPTGASFKNNHSALFSMLSLFTTLF